MFAKIAKASLLRVKFTHKSIESYQFRKFSRVIFRTQQELLESFPKQGPILENPFPLAHKHILMQKVEDDCWNKVVNRIDEKVDHLNELPPAAFVCFPKGGKTSALSACFDRLKKEGVNPILISLKNAAQFNEIEDHAQVILRMVTAALLGISPDKVTTIASVETLNFYFQGHKVVLLIDDLHCLGDSVDLSGATLLREVFVDPAGRYLVFSCLHPVGIPGIATDPNGDLKDHSWEEEIDCFRVATTGDSEDMKQLTGWCNSVTEATAVWCGYSPALVYAINNGTSLYEIYQQYKVTIPHHELYQVLKAFVGELIDGRRHQYPSNDDFKYFQNVKWSGSFTYPLCFIYYILRDLNYGEDGVRHALSYLSEIKNSLDKRNIELVWKNLVHTSIVLRMLTASWYGGYASPFQIKSDTTKPQMDFITLHKSIVTIDQAVEQINTLKYGKPTLVLVTLSYDTFETFDGFVIYDNGQGDRKVVGYKVTADIPPPIKVHSAINRAILIYKGPLKYHDIRELTSGWNLSSFSEVELRGFRGHVEYL